MSELLKIIEKEKELRADILGLIKNYVKIYGFSFQEVFDEPALSAPQKTTMDDSTINSNLNQDISIEKNEHQITPKKNNTFNKRSSSIVNFFNLAIKSIESINHLKEISENNPLMGLEIGGGKVGHVIRINIVEDYKLCLQYHASSDVEISQSLFLKNKPFIADYVKNSKKSFSAALLSESSFNISSTEGRTLALNWLKENLPIIKHAIGEHTDRIIETIKIQRK